MILRAESFPMPRLHRSKISRRRYAFPRWHVKARVGAELPQQHLDSSSGPTSLSKDVDALLSQAFFTHPQSALAISKSTLSSETNVVFRQTETFWSVVLSHQQSRSHFAVTVQVISVADLEQKWN